MSDETRDTLGGGLILDGPTRAALAAYMLSWADDELVLGHRDSEWTGFAPQIEEDVAFSSIAQDELGHATLLYGLAGGLTGDDPDRLALRRAAPEYRHVALVERPNGDWAHTIARHYLYDLADAIRIDALRDSLYGPLAAAARKMAREEHYHLLHDATWWERLRDGTPESAGRLATAARDILPLAVDLFGEIADEDRLVAAGILPCPSAALLEEWRLGLPGALVGQPQEQGPRQSPQDPPRRLEQDRLEQDRDGALLPSPPASTLWSALARDLPGLVAVAPTPREGRTVGADFQALHAEMTSVSASGLGETW